MYEARSAGIFGSTNLALKDLFLRLKIHRICADIPRFDIENLNFMSVWLHHEILDIRSFSVNPVGLYCALPEQYKTTVDP